MTTDTRNTVNTEFSLPVTEAVEAVKAADVEYIVIERCWIGAAILTARAQAVKAANIETWWQAEGEGWIMYVRHMKSCDACKTFEIARKANREDLPTEEK